MAKLKVRHMVLTRGDYRIVVNYVKRTGAIIDAALMQGDRIITVTDDPEVIKRWTEVAN